MPSIKWVCTLINGCAKGQRVGCKGCKNKRQLGYSVSLLQGQYTQAHCSNGCLDETGLTILSLKG